jgi:hypothetical protein
MIPIHYPEPAFRIKQEQGKDFIFDQLRKKWLLLTPEEWVRQNFIQYLVQVKKVPATLIAIEKEIMLGELKKRFDILVYDADHKPWMMVECKSGSVVLDEAVLQQVLRYNISIPVKHMIVTNGKAAYGWERTEKSLLLMADVPEWK